MKKPEEKKGFPMVPVAIGIAALAALTWFVLHSTETPTPPAPAAQPDIAQVAVPPPPPAPVEAAPAPEKKAPEIPKDAVLVPVDTNPPGASISVDGEATTYVTPTNLPLAPGKSHNLVITLKGYKEYKTSISAKSGSKVSVKLTESDRVVLVTSTPPRADVLLDGKVISHTGTTDPAKVKIPNLSKGHELTVHKAGFVDDTRTIGSGTAFETKDGKEVLEISVTLVAKPEAPKDEKKDGEKPDEKDSKKSDDKKDSKKSDEKKDPSPAKEAQ